MDYKAKERDFAAWLCTITHRESVLRHNVYS